MLFSKPIADVNFEDVEEFCRRFRENVRVEYKSTFDDNVKKNLAKVLSSFANSYGGVLLIGINAPNGEPREPLDGITFDDREPALTVQNICREAIFPEIPLYARFVPSRTEGKGFLLAQVDESPKAPHAIENTTKVYIRTGESSQPSLAPMDLLDRLLLRRREVQGRRDDFISQSWQFASALGISQQGPHREIVIGPRYPYQRLLLREAVYDFLDIEREQELAVLQLGRTLRTPMGALAQDQARYLNIGELGILHFVEVFQNAAQATALDFWAFATRLLLMVRLSSALVERAAASSEFRIEANLQNISGRKFLSNTHNYDSLEISTVARSVPAVTDASSHNLARSASDIAAELMYQLRWPFGVQPAPSRAVVKRNVEIITRGI